jgi:hypothetical protein
MYLVFENTLAALVESLMRYIIRAVSGSHHDINQDTSSILETTFFSKSSRKTSSSVFSDGALLPGVFLIGDSYKFLSANALVFCR